MSLLKYARKTASAFAVDDDEGTLNYLKSWIYRIILELRVSQIMLMQTAWTRTSLTVQSIWDKSERRRAGVSGSHAGKRHGSGFWGTEQSQRNSSPGTDIDTLWIIHSPKNHKHGGRVVTKMSVSPNGKPERRRGGFLCFCILFFKLISLFFVV